MKKIEKEKYRFIFCNIVRRVFSIERVLYYRKISLGDILKCGIIISSCPHR